jgi:isocitrate lyase
MSVAASESRAVKKPGASGDRFAGIVRPYSTKDVERLRGSIRIEHTLARLGA